MRRVVIHASDLLTIFSALDWYEMCGMARHPEHRPAIIDDIATNGGSVTALSGEGLMDLTRRLNGVDEIVVEYPNDTSAISGPRDNSHL